MTQGEREFGTILIDMGGGQTSASVIHDDQLKFSYVDQEGGDLVSKDISVVLNTSFDNAERIKREYGYAISEHTSSDEFFPVETIGKKDPVKVDEHYLSEIIEARLVQTFENIKRALDQVEALQLPGGIVMTGGASSMEGVVELAEEIFGVNIRTYIPEQIGMRNPVFSTSMGLIEYSASLDDVHRIAQQGKLAMGRSHEAKSPVNRPSVRETTEASFKHAEKEIVEVAEKVEEHIEEGAETLWDKIKNFIKMFID